MQKSKIDGTVYKFGKLRKLDTQNKIKFVTDYHVVRSLALVRPCLVLFPLIVPTLLFSIFYKTV